MQECVRELFSVSSLSPTFGTQIPTPKGTVKLPVKLFLCPLCPESFFPVLLHLKGGVMSGCRSTRKGGPVLHSRLSSKVLTVGTDVGQRGTLDKPVSWFTLEFVLSTKIFLTKGVQSIRLGPLGSSCRELELLFPVRVL